MILRTPCRAAMSSTSALTSAGVSREQHRRAARAWRSRSKIVEPDVEVVERALADRARRFARAFEIVELGHRGLARFSTNLLLIFVQVALQLRVVQLDVRALLEVHRRDLHGSPSGQAPGGRSPASTSATCSTCVFASPRRRSRPSMFSMQPRSPSTTASAPTGHDVLAFVVGEARRDLAELDRERAAEAAARLAFRHLRELARPASWPSSARGCDLTPISRSPAQESW